MTNESRFTSANLAYIYSDYSTAFLGEFKDKVMRNATNARVTATRCRKVRHINVLAFSVWLRNKYVL